MMIINLVWRVLITKVLVVFEHGSPVNIEDGSFEVNESRWTLRFKPLISSVCPRKTPKLFKVRIWCPNQDNILLNAKHGPQN